MADVVAQPPTDSSHPSPPTPGRARRPAGRNAPFVPTWAAKTVMAVTGLVFTSFVLVHMIGNLKVFSGAVHFDGYAAWLRTLLVPLVPPQGALWLLRIVLVLCLGAHLWCSVLLVRRSRTSAGPHRRRTRPGAASFGARSMLFTGVVLLFFVVFHILDMTTGTAPIAPESFVPGSAYSNVVASFSRPWVAAFYGITMLLLAVHIAHGVRTAAGDLGVTGIRSRVGFAVVGGIAGTTVLLGNAAIPVAVQAGWLS